MSLSYAEYLKIDELLALQQCRSQGAKGAKGAEHDELLFIVIHQVYELWFKLLLHELDHIVERLDADAPVRAQKGLTRALKVLKTLVAQIDVLETMTPLEFLSFRDFLEQGSGFQSAQFREIEFLLGKKRAAPIALFAPGTAARERLQRRYDAPTLWDRLLAYLARRGCPIPADCLERDPREPPRPDPRVQEILLDIYRNRRPLAALCELFIDLDEGLQEWRYRHVQMVRRTIGAKMGTGGSSGAEYLQNTLFHPAFPDLWAIRSRF